jgi:lysophospholipase L1-like esterase
MNVVRALAIAGWPAIAAGCGAPPTTPPPPIPALTITCPSATPVQSMDANPVVVSFSQPTTAGGVAPVNTTCSPGAGSEFPVGPNVVSCSATDARGVSALCSFAVTVRPPPRLVGTRFVAFGDSITWGVDSPPVRAASPSFAYPEQLQRKLVGHYRFQSPQVVNEGRPGEAAQDTGVTRIREALQRHRPDIVLLMEGSNDLLGSEPIAADRAIDALRSMIRTAKDMGVRVGIATIAPQRAGGARNRGRVAGLIPGFNDRIRSMAAAENVVLIDVYAAMKDDLSLIGEDDLHPTVRGFDVIAETFFEAIKLGFDETPAPAPAPGGVR